MSELIEKLKWRYAAKRMTGETIPAEKLNNILESINLAPSSVGLQPYNVIVVQDQATKEKIHVAAPQPQVLEASHILIFAAWEKISTQDISKYIDLIADTRGISKESLAGFQSSINGGILSRTEEANFQWAARQAYIGLGHALVAAAVEQVDATPMEGFDAKALDEILGLNEKGLRSVVIVTLGYRDSEKDPLSGAKKVRRPHDDFFITV
ncbi:NAD(P)H-dependent oxidoreductase [Dyadobacter sp. Leaf189]|uniref:NAD(P)H-dependent oxidoreductase n=1 Tax=Dyadobacter sp. Leaf189 TaxID=1736295 RepID=UPI0006F922CD|nr:NAD(P)H-dependent oxidoreductase [Dyadobacter sp. Leaf189]KQS31238.1 NAD(P)H-dependent oxidoreductase [Dyadobacter sp. Leaf189]